MIFLHSCSIKRSAEVGTNGRHQKTLVSSSNTCLFVSMPSRAEMEGGFSVGTAYDVYFPTDQQDVKTGDQLEWDGGTFNVRAARPYAVPRVGHMHVLATREGI